jgi:hypothetical protein
MERNLQGRKINRKSAKRVKQFWAVPVEINFRIRLTDGDNTLTKPIFI